MTTGCTQRNPGRVQTAPRSVGRFGAEAERGFEVVLRVGTERDVRLGRLDAGHLVEPVGDHARDVVVLVHPHHDDQVDVAGHGVDLADTVETGDLLGDLGDAGNVGLDEDDRGDHGTTLGDQGWWTVASTLRSSNGMTLSRAVSAADIEAIRPPAPPSGQVQMPSMSNSRIPGDSSQRSTHSVSDADAAGVGPGPVMTVSALATRLAANALPLSPGRSTPAAASRPCRTTCISQRPLSSRRAATTSGHPVRADSRWVRALPRRKALSRSRCTPASS